MLTQEQLMDFLSPFKKVPLIAGAGAESNLDLTLKIDIAVRYAPIGFYEIRLFPCLDEKSVDTIKKSLVEQAAQLTSEGRLDEAAQLPSLEDTANRKDYEFNPFPIWRIEKLFENARASAGYVLEASRFMPDPILGAPSIMLSYKADGKPGIDVFLLTTPLSPHINAVLSHVQQLSEQSAAAARVAEVERTEGGIDKPRIITP